MFPPQTTFDPYDNKAGAFEPRGPLAPTTLSTGELNTNVYCAGIPHTYSQDDLVQLCQPFGEIISVKVLIDGATGKGRGVGFVKFKNVTAANACISNLQGKIVDGGTEQMVCRLAKDKVQEEGKGYAPPISSRGPPVNYMPSYAPPPPMSNTGYPGYGYPNLNTSTATQYPTMTQASTYDPYASLTPQLPTSMPNTMDLNSAAPTSYPSYYGMANSNPNANSAYMYPPAPTDLTTTQTSTPLLGTSTDGSYIGMTSPPGYNPYGNGKPALSQPLSYQPALQPQNLGAKPRGGEPQVEGEPSPNLFVLHLPAEIRDAELKNLFANYGTVTGAKVMIDQMTGNSKGFGFVNFQDISAASAARQALNNYSIGSKTIKVSFKAGKK
jgi:hypothetical protein